MITKILYLIAFIVLFFQGYLNLDPDFGWHYRMGQIISTTGIPQTDPLSYSMPSFHFIDYEWLFNVAIYQLHRVVGYTGLALIFSLISCFSLYLIFSVVKTKSLGQWPNVILLWVIATIFPFGGVRTQIISWLFLAIYVRLFLREKDYLRYRLLSLPLIVLWSNLHGSFPLGIIIISLTIFGRFLSKKFDKADLLLLPTNILFTLLNPYGIDLWREIFRTMADSNLKSRISEWAPTIFSYQLLFVCLAVLSCLAIYHHWEKFKVANLIIYIFFFVEAILSQRHIPVWLLVSVPLTLEAFQLFYEEIKNLKYSPGRFATASVYALKFSFIIFFLQMFVNFHPFITINNGYATYPEEAVAHLRQHAYSGLMFSHYNWGGYLDFQLPQSKVFIDGRMPCWQQSNVSNLESTDAMKDFIDAGTTKEGFDKLVAKYPIKIILWPNNVPEAKVIKLPPSIEKLFPKSQKPFDFVQNLVSEGWTKVFSNQTSVIFVRDQ